MLTDRPGDRSAVLRVCHQLPPAAVGAGAAAGHGDGEDVPATLGDDGLVDEGRAQIASDLGSPCSGSICSAVVCSSVGSRGGGRRGG